MSYVSYRINYILNDIANMEQTFYWDIINLREEGVVFNVLFVLQNKKN